MTMTLYIMVSKRVRHPTLAILHRDNEVDDADVAQLLAAIFGNQGVHRCNRLVRVDRYTKLRGKGKETIFSA